VATVRFIQGKPAWQRYGSQAWNLPVGDGDTGWLFSARPFEPNLTARLDSVNANWQSTDVVVNLVTYGGGPADGGIIRINRVQVS
jgi:hypothetical protein